MWVLPREDEAAEMEDDPPDWDTLRKKRRGDARCCLEIELENGERIHLLFCALKHLGRWSSDFDAVADDLCNWITQRCSLCSCCVTFFFIVLFDLFAFSVSKLSAETAGLVAFFGFPVILGLLREVITRSKGMANALLIVGLAGIFTSLCLWLWAAGQQASTLMVVLGNVPLYLLWLIFRCRFPGPFQTPHFAETDNKRGKVCSWCEVERVRFDHHCIWINSCVHAGTHHSFVILLAVAALSSLSFAAFVLLPAFQASSLAQIHRESPVMFTVAAMDAAVGCNILAVFLMQLWCIARNLTVNELFNRRRYFELESRPRPVSLGCLRNCQAFWRGYAAPSHVWPGQALARPSHGDDTV